MGIKDRLRGGLARQLGQPRGVVGRCVGSMLNRGNRDTVAAAVEALDLVPGQAAADIGFGGGLSLALLLARVGPAGRVYGAEISQAMLRRARRRHRDAIADGRLVLDEAPMSHLRLPDGSVDALMTVNTVYFVADLSKPFAEFARVLSPGGRLVVGLGDPGVMGREPLTSHGFVLRPVAEVSAGLAAAGLTVAGHRRVGADPDGFHLLVARPLNTGAGPAVPATR